MQYIDWIKGIKAKKTLNTEHLRVLTIKDLFAEISGARWPTVAAVIVHQYDFLQQPSRCLVDDAADGSFDDRKSFIQVD